MRLTHLPKNESAIKEFRGKGMAPNGAVPPRFRCLSRPCAPHSFWVRSVRGAFNLRSPDRPLAVDDVLDGERREDHAQQWRKHEICRGAKQAREAYGGQIDRERRGRQ